ncbi:hypothetical protein PHYBOEH_003933 [Phytophthora boehmeriae]|uniref:CID domain-containing protein n=1 Tax=Phytophthora boehmeriae TaxID=109152 RepID=A0A8T1WMS8_9STRA|nr:hypothetical protein PHYBOEH_003933 [Phytophthora boehmeriae]
MDEFLADLRELDDSQERVEAVSDGMMRVQRSGDADKAREMVESWIQALRASDFQSERVAFLYVANHVMQKSLFGEVEKKNPIFVELFKTHLDEAVALVCNSPMDRLNVTRLLELWHEKKVFSDIQVLKMWKCTGEDLPSFLEAVATATDSSAASKGEEVRRDVDLEELPENGNQNAELHNTLPMKLNAHSANPVLDVLKKIDHQKAAVRYLDQQIRERHQFLLRDTVMRYQTATDLVNDRTTASSQVKQRVEDCLRLVKVRNKFIRDADKLKTELKEAVANMLDYEEDAASKIEQKLEQCDEIDLGLMDLSDHLEKFPNEWSDARIASLERRRQREELQRQKDEEIARLHHEAIAESAVHAMNLEADMNATSNTDMQSLAKEFKDRPQDKEAKVDNENELVWNPIRKELVPLRSLNVDWEDWRDH